MKKTQKLVHTGILLASLGWLSCGDVEKKPANATIPDQTPVAAEALSDLAPDMTFNDNRSVLEVLRGNTDYDMFYKALKSADMVSKLDSSKVITIFAPTNIAFNRITEAKLAQLMSPDGKFEMTKLLQYHIVEDEYDFETLESTIRLNENILRLKTLNGGYIALTIENDEVFITDETGFQSKIIRADEEAANGVVHGINAVLLAR